MVSTRALDIEVNLYVLGLVLMTPAMPDRALRACLRPSVASGRCVEPAPRGSGRRGPGRRRTAGASPTRDGCDHRATSSSGLPRPLRLVTATLPVERDRGRLTVPALNSSRSRGLLPLPWAGGLLVDIWAPFAVQPVGQEPELRLTPERMVAGRCAPLRGKPTPLITRWVDVGGPGSLVCSGSHR